MHTTKIDPIDERDPGAQAIRQESREAKHDRFHGARQAGERGRQSELHDLVSIDVIAEGDGTRLVRPNRLQQWSLVSCLVSSMQPIASSDVEVVQAPARTADAAR